MPVRERTTRRMPGRKTGRRFPPWQNKIWRKAKLPVRERTTRRMPGRKTGRRFPAWQNKIWRPPNCQFVNARHGGCRVGKQTKACRGCWVGKSEKRSVSSSWPFDHRSQRVRALRKVHWTFRSVFDGPLLTYPCRAGDAGSESRQKPVFSFKPPVAGTRRPTAYGGPAFTYPCRTGDAGSGKNMHSTASWPKFLSLPCRGCWVGKSEKRFVSSSWPFDHRSQCVRALRKVHWTFRSVFDGPLLTYPCRAGDG